MRPTTESHADSDDGTIGDGPARPGLVIVYADRAPRSLVIPLENDMARVGRDQLAALGLGDTRASRDHVAVFRDVTRWRFQDLGSRNGTFVDGARCETIEVAAPRVLRIGDTILLPVPDVRPYLARPATREGDVVVGCTLGRAWGLVDRAARAGDVLHVRGETGAGKELAARRFHDAGARSKGPFIAVNCAALPSALAERLLFGVKKGTYTGAETDADGFVQAAHGGTLFLDEIAQLDTSVQAKLLRVLETREVLRLGGSVATRVSFGVCSATTADLEREVAQGRFREDLFFRIGLPTVEIPPLRDRPEEIPWLVQNVVATKGPLTVRPSSSSARCACPGRATSAR